MRPRLAFRFRVREQMHATVRVSAAVIAAHRRGTKNLFEPTQIVGSWKSLRHALRPTAAESLHFTPTLFPTEPRENRLRQAKKFRKHSRCRQELNFLQPVRDRRLVV